MPLINGQLSDTISVMDRGLHYGDGLFETIAVKDGKLSSLWGRHMARLRRGCERLGISPVDETLLWQEATDCCHLTQSGILKIIVTRGAGGRGYRAPENRNATRILAMYPAVDYPRAYRETGIAMRVCGTRLACNETLAGLKHLNRLEQVLARSEWIGADIAEGLMLDTSGAVIEGTMTNLFFARDGGLKTPDLSQCGVAGVMREAIIDAAGLNALSCEIGRYTLHDLEEADEIFVCNSVIGIWPVRQLESRHYGTQSITSQVAAWFAF